MQRILVYDLPTRLFHWLFAGSFVAAFSIAELIDDDSIWFSLHMLAGLCLAGGR
jgi:cytochrome b